MAQHTQQRRFYTLEQAIRSGDVKNADILLWRARGPVSLLIARLCGGEHSHAAMVGWWCVGEAGSHSLPMVIETREFIGSRTVTLASAVSESPCYIDVFRVLDGHASTEELSNVVHTMRCTAGQDYGWLAVFKAAIYRLPFWRFFASPSSYDGEVNTFPEFCSQLVAQAYRLGADIDIVPFKPDSLTTPPDLAHSGLLQYRFTLCTEVGKCKKLG